MSNTFKVAGVSKQNGEFKVRFANDILRVKVLEKNKHTGIDLIELPREMDKDAIPEYLLSIDFDNGNKEVRACLEAAHAQRSGTVKMAKPKVTAKKKTTPSMDAIAARAKAAKKLTDAEVEAEVSRAEAAEIEDAPF